VRPHEERALQRRETARETRSAVEGPPATLRRRTRIDVGGSLAELWRSQELVVSLVEREYRVRYKQAVLGFAWALAQPLALIVVFAVFFRQVATVDTDGAPYAIFVFLALLPWVFFASSVTFGSVSLLNNESLVQKIYCPREVFPLASVAVAGLDMLISLGVLSVAMAVTGTAPAATTFWVLPLLGVQVAFTLAVALILSVVVVYIRDIRHVVPVVIQLGLFATPIAYSLDAIPEGSRLVYSIINPLAPVIDGYRRAVLYGTAPDWGLVGPAALTAGVLLVVSYYAFKRLERGIADLL